MSYLKEAAHQVVANCLKMKKDENTVMILDLETKHIAEAIIDEIKKVTSNFKKYIMEDMGERPEDGSNPLKISDESVEAISKADVSLYVAQGKKGELNTFRKPLLTAIQSNKNLRHAHMIMINDEIMKQGMRADYELVQGISKKVYDLVSNCKEIRVTTALGTDFTATISPKLKWIISDGDLSKPGKWSNLPDGEVFTCPESVNGHVVIDGCLGDYFGPKTKDISKTPVVMDIKDGRIVEGSVKTTHPWLQEELPKYIFADVENSERIGEFAIGTNVGLTSIIGNLLQDEKYPGVHIAWGDSYSEMTGADWKCETQHCDGVIKNVTVEVDGKMIIQDGSYFLY